MPADDRFEVAAERAPPTVPGGRPLSRRAAFTSRVAVMSTGSVFLRRWKDGTLRAVRRPRRAAAELNIRKLLTRLVTLHQRATFIILATTDESVDGTRIASQGDVRALRTSMSMTSHLSCWRSITMHRFWSRLFGGSMILAVVFLATACSYDSPSVPNIPTPTPGPAGATISITASGLSPGAVTITPGQSVTFVNMDTVAHDIASTPVPTYDDCPGINRVGRLEPGQSTQTDALTAARACGFLDLLRIGDSRWQGTVTIQQ